MLFEARFSRVADVGLGLPGPQRLDGLEEEVQGDEYVEDEADQDPGPDALGQVLDHVGAGTEQEDDGVDGGHDDEGEARLVVGQVDEVDRLVEHVGEGPVALPRVEGAVRVLEVTRGDREGAVDGVGAGVGADDVAVGDVGERGHERPALQLLLLLGQLDGTPLFRLLLAVGRGDDRRRRGRRRVLGWRGRMPRRVVFVSSVGTGRFSDRHRTCSVSAGRRYAPPGPTTPYQYTPRTLVAKGAPSDSPRLDRVRIRPVRADRGA